MQSTSSSPTSACAKTTFPAADVAESEEAAGFRLVSLEALVRMKLTAFCDEDRVHLRDLADVGLTADLVASLPAELQDRLAQLLSMEE